MGSVVADAMRRKAMTLLAAVAVALVAAGGASAAVIDDPAESALENESDGGDTEVGVCVVGVDSPCNGEDAEKPPATDDNHSEEGQMWIPEDQNRDGEIDERFGGEDSADVVHENGTGERGWDIHPTPHNGSEIGEDSDGEDSQILLPEDQNRDGQIDERFGGGESDGESNQIWIPEDQNRDGLIDERFTEDSRTVLGVLLPGLFGLF